MLLKIIGAANLALILALGYGLYSMNITLTDRINRIESESDLTQSVAERDEQARSETEAKLTDALADLEDIKERLGGTSVAVKHAREMAQSLKRQQEQAAKDMARQLEAKANSSDVDTLRQEASTKIAELQQDSDKKIGNVSGELTGIRRDLVATRDDFGRQLIDVKNVLSDRIARNSTELAELRKKGDRDYIEFDIRRNSKQPFQRVADIQLSVVKTDPAKHKYNVGIKVDDARLEKKDRTTNEPVQFLVGRDQLRYELVVNSVDKDRLRGYLSVPKDRTLAGESPRFRAQ